jgi:hypothetical protein
MLLLLYNYIKPNKSEVFIYYTGYGASDVETKTAYFVSSDCHPNYVKLNGYLLDLFYENLSKLSAKSVNVIIDTCFSGGSQKRDVNCKSESVNGSTNYR